MEQLFFPVTQKKASQTGVGRSSTENKNAVFPTQLRALRKEKGVSQDELSKVLGVSKSTVGLWETGDTLPDARSLHDLAIYYGVSADYLLGLSDIKSIDVDIQRACNTTGLSDDAILALQDSVYGSSALNYLLLQQEFRNLLMNIFFFMNSSIAAAAYSRIESEIYQEDEISKRLAKFFNSSDAPEEIKDALKLHINTVKNYRIASDVGLFSPKDFYELRANKNLSTLLDDISGDCWLQAEFMFEKSVE